MHEAYSVKRDITFNTQQAKVLVWLPSPMGDAILCTPALRAIRKYFKTGKIAFYANSVVRHALSPSVFNDVWLEINSKNPFSISKELKKHKFTHAILLKNSFASALAVRLAAIPNRIGYAREKRGFLLTEKLYPQKLPNGIFKPVSMVDYYLQIASYIGAQITETNLELSIDQNDSEYLVTILPELADTKAPIVILVPGGAFGPSKCWPAERFAKTADRLIEEYKATIVISVAPIDAEKQIANEICKASKYSNPANKDGMKNKIINLAEKSLSLGQLKALYSLA
ncbi:glycosyltransferase family 9 protein, partial [Planctomycetota bacterium]